MDRNGEDIQLVASSVLIVKEVKDNSTDQLQKQFLLGI